MMKRLPIIIIFIINYPISLQVTHGQTSGVINSYLSENPVVLDGKWTTTSEWMDAIEIKLVPRIWETFPSDKGEAYCRVKHDLNYLYVLFDFVSDRTLISPKIENLWTDSATVVLDLGGGEFNRVGYVLSRWEGQVWQGKLFMKNGSWDWYHGQQNSGIVYCSYEASPYSKSPHMIYEFRIPFATRSDTLAYLVCMDTSAQTHLIYPAPEIWNLGILRFHNKTLADVKTEALSSAQEVSTLLKKAEEKIASVNSSDPRSPKAKTVLKNATQYYSAGVAAMNINDFNTAKRYAQEAMDSAYQAISIERLYSNAAQLVNDTRNSIAKARSEQRTTLLEEANELLGQAESALLDNDYAKSVVLAEKANLLAENSKKEQWQTFPQALLILMGSFEILLFFVGGISLAIATPFIVRRHLRRTDARVCDFSIRYERYLAKLAELKDKGRISEKAYLHLKHEYEKRSGKKS